DQGVCWAIVVLISAAFVLRLLPARLGAVRESPHSQESQWGRAGRLEHWQELADRAAQSQEGRMAFQANLTALADAVAESTKQSGRPAPPTIRKGWSRVPLLGLLAGSRQLSELRALEDQLSSMESALEIKYEDSID
ncbi:MAG TPA: hypothetical protein VFH29_03990, partial [Anaerolineales bacterium]|nr:hypothetical protein [Anaerolineales bacterium]